MVNCPEFKPLSSNVSSFFLASTVEAEGPYRMIAILENERMLQAEPDIHLAGYFDSNDAKVRSRAVLAAGRIGNPAILLHCRA